MHGLDIIIQRNLEAAGREAAHADNDGNDELATTIHTNAVQDTGDPDSPEWTAFCRGYLAGRREG